jgi:hypothetical protein
MIKVKAEVILDFESKDDADRVFIAVTPDNTPLPHGLVINSYVDNKRIVFEVGSERSLESAITTIEDLMSAVDLSLRTTRCFSHKNDT